MKLIPHNVCFVESFSYRCSKQDEKWGPSDHQHICEGDFQVKAFVNYIQIASDYVIIFCDRLIFDRFRIQQKLYANQAAQLGEVS